MILHSYNRVSTDDQKTGIQVYRESIERFCKYGNHEIVGVYEDEDVSGGMPFRERPQGKLIYESLMNGDVDGMVADNISRVFRSAADGFATIEEFRDAGVKFFICDQGQVPLDVDSEQGFMLFSFQLMYAQLERMKIKKRTSDAHKMRRKNGLATTHAQYGYNKISDTQYGNLVNRVVPCEKEQEVVKQIMELHISNISNYSIAKFLNNNGIPAKKGGIWTGKTIKGVIDYQLEISK
jgi:DNA invertase Pin-like site-specific DNA recombinase